MLLREQGDSVIAIGQASHAWIAGQLARAWGNARFPAPEPREEVCLAAEQHDIGWGEWDLRPSLDPSTGLPHSFLEVPLETHIALWSAAPAKLTSQCCYAALLVSMHGAALNERRDPARLGGAHRELVAKYLAAQRELQTSLAAQLRADGDQLARNQRLVWMWDSLSLALCLKWRELATSDGERELVLAPTDAERFTLDPWPFGTKRMEARCEGRLLEGRFDDEAQLHAALEHSPIVELTFALEPT
jgi:hypothetical protein